MEPGSLKRIHVRSHSAGPAELGTIVKLFDGAAAPAVKVRAEERAAARRPVSRLSETPEPRGLWEPSWQQVLHRPQSLGLRGSGTTEVRG